MIPSTTIGGSAWDPLGGAPDPFVCLYLNDSTTPVSYSNTLQESFSPTWNKSWDVQVTAITKVELVVSDEDAFANDRIESLAFAINGLDLLAKARAGGFQGSGRDGRVKWNVQALIQ